MRPSVAVPAARSDDSDTFVEKLLEQGRSQWYQSREKTAREFFDQIWHYAVTHGLVEAAAWAVLGPEFPFESAGRGLAERANRCRWVLAHFDDEPTTLHVRVWATLASLEWNLGRDAAGATLSRARTLAAAVADPVADLYVQVAESLIADASAGAEARVRTARRILTGAHQHGVHELAHVGYFLLLSALLHNGDIMALDVELSWRSPWLERFGWLEHTRTRGRFRCVRSLLDGDGDLAEALAEKLLAAGEQVGDPDSLSVWITHMAIVAWLRGDIDAMEPLFRRARQLEPDEPLWPASLAWLWLLQGRDAAAHALLAQLPSLDQVRRTRNSFATLIVLSEIAITTESDTSFARLYQYLLPAADHAVSIGAGVAFWGTAARTLGLLAERLGRVDEAREHLQASITVCLRAGAQPWLAESQLELAGFLIRQGELGGDVRNLLRQAHTGAERLGLNGLKQRVAQAQAILPTAGVVEAAWEGRGGGHTGSPPKADAAEVKIFVLGRFDVVGLDGSSIRWTSRKARTLLKMLICHRGVAVRRDQLMELLWPGEPRDRLGNRFSVALATVRRALDPERRWPTNHYVELRDESLRLRVDRVRIDLEEFFTHVRGTDPDQLERGVATYLGDAFPDELDARWADAVRDEAQLAFCAAADRLAWLKMDSNRLVAACSLFRRVIAVDPYNAGAHEGLAQALTLMGAHGPAELVAEQFNQRLAEL